MSSKSQFPLIDISEFNTVTDYSVLAKNVSGVIIRLGYSSYSSGRQRYDAKYAQHMNGCRMNNIPYGLYFFPQSINEEEAKNEADFIIDSVRGLKLSFPVFLDSEFAEQHGLGRADGLSKSARTQQLKYVIDILKKNNIECGVYASTNWFETRLDMSKLGNIPIWVAQYNTHVTYKGRYDIWQYTSNGTVQGIKGRVDLNKITQEVKPEKPFTPYAAAVKVATNLAVRDEPSTKGDVLFRLPNNWVVAIHEEKNGWGRLGDINAWVNLKYVTKG